MCDSYMNTLCNLLLDYVMHLHELYYILTDVYACAPAWCSWIDLGCPVEENLCHVLYPQDVGSYLLHSRRHVHISAAYRCLIKMKAASVLITGETLVVQKK